MIQQLRSKLGRLQMLAQKKVGIDPKELHELLREMDIRSGGDGEYWLCPLPKTPQSRPSVWDSLPCRQTV